MICSTIRMPSALHRGLPHRGIRASAHNDGGVYIVSSSNHTLPRYTALSRELPVIKENRPQVRRIPTLEAQSETPDLRLPRRGVRRAR